MEDGVEGAHQIGRLLRARHAHPTNAGAPLVAFPTASYFPYEALHASFQSVDETGWTIQSDAIDLSSAQVTVTDGANTMPVQVVQLLGGYGSAQAINFLPQGWQAQSGHTYHVSVSGASQPIEYVTSCAASSRHHFLEGGHPVAHYLQGG